MDGQEFTDTVRTAHRTPLSRLGSSKWVFALTGGEMESPAVEAAWATEAGAAAETLAAWAEDEPNADAAAVFANAAETAADHGGSLEDAPTPQMYETLSAIEGTPARVGSLLARTIVTEQTLAQMVGFFEGDANPSTASTFRDRRSDLKSELTTVENLLETVCADDADWDAARDGADRVIEAAYDDYVETLESMGIKPKNVC